MKWIVSFKKTGYKQKQRQSIYTSDNKVLFVETIMQNYV